MSLRYYVTIRSCANPDRCAIYSMFDDREELMQALWVAFFNVPDSQRLDAFQPIKGMILGMKPDGELRKHEVTHSNSVHDFTILIQCFE